MKFAYIQVGLVLIAAFVAVVLYLVRSRQGAAFRQKHPWVSYLLVWPLILDANKGARSGHLFTVREWFGWAVVAALIAGGVLFFS